MYASAACAKGLCLVNAMHIAASVFINDDEPGLYEDWMRPVGPRDCV